MVLLIMKLDQLDQDIENALSTSSSPSSTPTNLRRHVDLESGSESGADTISVNQAQTNLSSNIESTDLPSSTPVASSGTKPKSTDKYGNRKCRFIPDMEFSDSVNSWDRRFEV
ncbi:Rho GTPase-activating protein 7 [Pteropus alecto]|uniref:Rho GTPase-activating protein 7 n=1 Tax=Pteropus alecto TaxID=9402 RepID=L5KB85_PTEAL|nr:Rho GTPase-activating protein 7 [Pteropus alecto]